MQFAKAIQSFLDESAFYKPKNSQGESAKRPAANDGHVVMRRAEISHANQESVRKSLSILPPLLNKWNYGSKIPGREISLANALAF